MCGTSSASLTSSGTDAGCCNAKLVLKKVHDPHLMSCQLHPIQARRCSLQENVAQVLPSSRHETANQAGRQASRQNSMVSKDKPLPVIH
jgi:hypothetical protein